MPGQIDWEDAGVREYVQKLENGDLILVERDSDGQVLLEWDETNGTFQKRGDVSHNGNNISDVGSIDATSVSTGEAIIGTTGSSPIKSVEESVNDDDVLIVSRSSPVIIGIDADGGANQGLFVGGFDALETAAKLSNITNQGSTTLNGTTGPDGSLNVARDGGDIRVENRLGSQSNVRVFTIEF